VNISQHSIALETESKENLYLITGGPGTGKTTAAARLLLQACLQHWRRFKRAPLIALAAPTGKAAARLNQAFAAQLDGLLIGAEAAPEVVAALRTVQAQTVHRLLGFAPATDQFSANELAPLVLDVLLVDESSMLSLRLLHALFAGIDFGERRHRCKLILLGDAQQLAAVESGTPFADLIEALPHCVLTLTEQWRALPELAQASSAVRQTLTSPQTEHNAHVLQAMTALSRFFWPANDASGIKELLRQQVLLGVFDPLFQAQSAAQALATQSRLAVLCATHEGTHGQRHANAMLETALREHYRLGRVEHFRGRLLMAVRNDYHLGVMNGDVGVCWPDQQGELKVWFSKLSADGEQTNELTTLSLDQAHELVPAWAMTVHKAQGSEFDTVIVLLPEFDVLTSAKPALHGAVIYTAITRAKKELILCGREAVLELALAQTLRRRSGLAKALNFPIDSFAKANNFPVVSFAKANK
jgi:exodeoxyribonuclease V alpha subunit